MIKAFDANNNLIATGSGFCAFESNYIVTNYHVIEGAKGIDVYLTVNGKTTTYAATIVIVDKYNDLAILKIKDNNKCRIECNEITKNAVKTAVESPRVVNQSLVDAQQARRILDRIIGFLLSGIVQKKIKSRSAGRVQTPTLRLIYNHEKAIQEFVPEEFYDIDVKISYNGNDNISLTRTLG